jgi:hypothetical protein
LAPVIHDDISLIEFVIPGLPRIPVFSWISSLAGMTTFAGINDALYNMPEKKFAA